MPVLVLMIVLVLLVLVLVLMIVLVIVIVLVLLAVFVVSVTVMRFHLLTSFIRYELQNMSHLKWVGAEAKKESRNYEGGGKDPRKRTKMYIVIVTC